MKSFTIVAMVAVALMVACLIPSGQGNPLGHPLDAEAELVPDQEGRAARHARATCDLLSFTSKWVSVNHSACAAHCLALMKGFKGGYCKDTVCHCRK